jgi:hypothetical protein
MKIDLAQQVRDAEQLLASLRDLDGTEVEDDAHGRAAREHRAGLALRLQALAYGADTIRIALVGANLALRENQARGEAPAPETTSLFSPFG